MRSCADLLSLPPPRTRFVSIPRVGKEGWHELGGGEAHATDSTDANSLELSPDRERVSVEKARRNSYVYIYIYVRNEGPHTCAYVHHPAKRGAYMHRCTCATTRGCMMYIRHRVRRAVANMQNRWRGGDLTPGEAGPLFPVLAWRSCSRARRATIYAAVNHTLATTTPPFFLLNREKNRSTRFLKTNGYISSRTNFRREAKWSGVEPGLIRAERYRLF